MTDRTERLRAIFERLSDRTTFTEPQSEPRGWVHSDEETDAELAGVVERMRARYGFRTSLSDADLVTVVKGYYGGASDAELARRLGVSRETVGRARVNLQLFRRTDAPTHFERDDLERHLDDGASVPDIAATFAVSEDTVRRYAHLVEAQRAASRASHRYQTEFEGILSAAGVQTGDDAAVGDTAASAPR